MTVKTRVKVTASGTYNGKVGEIIYVLSNGLFVVCLDGYATSTGIRIYKASELQDLTPAPPSPPPPPPPPPAGMIVGLNASGWGTAGSQDVKACVDWARIDQDESNVDEHITNHLAVGLKINMLFSGPYLSSGVSGLPASWPADALAFYKAHCTPTNSPIVEVLNEPSGDWFWGANAGSQANADAYASLIMRTYDTFHAEYGTSAPKIIASVEDSNGIGWGKKFWNASVAAKCDGVVVHPYGGTGSRTSSALGNRQRVIDAHAYTGKPVYCTEVGWPTAPFSSSNPNSTSDSLQWTEADQATNIYNFITWAKSTGYVASVMIFGYRDYGTNAYYGVEHTDGTKKPAWTALHNSARGLTYP